MPNSDLIIDPEKPPTRRHWYYACTRCGRINDEYSAFGGRGWFSKREKSYCLGACIPLSSRVRLWWQERRDR